jgi:hypothetical protein
VAHERRDANVLEMRPLDDVSRGQNHRTAKRPHGPRREMSVSAKDQAEEARQ